MLCYEGPDYESWERNESNHQGSYQPWRQYGRASEAVGELSYPWEVRDSGAWSPFEKTVKTEWGCRSSCNEGGLQASFSSG